jgi:hypothetical protein
MPPTWCSPESFLQLTIIQSRYKKQGGAEQHMGLHKTQYKCN